MKRISIPAAIGLLLLIGCGPAINKVYLASEQYPPRPTDHPIQLYSEKLPECEFQELALVTAKPRTEGVSMETVTEGLRTAAREMGGDAIIRLQMGAIAKTNAEESLTSLTGTVIRFLKDGCRK